MSKRALIGLAAGVSLLFGAGLGLAQDTELNQTGETAASAPPPPNVIAPSPSPSLSTAAPPPESAPTAPEPAEDQAPPAPSNMTTSEAPAVPLTRPGYSVAVLQALDKVTAETLRFEVKVNEPVRYKDLVITLHACQTTAADEPVKDAAAHIEVLYQPDYLPPGAPAHQVFRGWMFAESPGLHPLTNAVYDVWMIACRTPLPAPPAVGGASL
jgi:hypothetical protein